MCDVQRGKPYRDLQGHWTESVEFKEQLIEVLNASKFGEKEYTPHQVYMKALVVCPASLRSMWKRELNDATIPFRIVSQEMLGQKHFRPEEYGELDVILVEESHNFRSRVSQRYQNLERIIALNGGRGDAGDRKKMILLEAAGRTPGRAGAGARDNPRLRIQRTLMADPCC
jgi:hypothetical protein